MSLVQDDLDHLDNADSESKLGLHVGKKMGMGRFTFTATGGKAIGAHSLDLYVPAGALVSRVVYKVLTTFTSATDAATIALKIVGANDVVSAVAISDGANPWDAGGAVACVPVTETVSSWLATTARVAVTATVAVEALTAGKLVGFVEWYYHGDVSAT